MEWVWKILIAVVVLPFLVACGGSSGGSGSTSTTESLNATSAKVAAAKANLAKAQVFSDSSSSSLVDTLATNADWTATNLSSLGDSSTCGTTTNAKDYMKAMTSRTCTVSPFFDLNNMVDMMCVLTNELDITDGLPDVTAQTAVTISSSTATLCDVADAADFAITYSVAETGTQTNYQRLISFDVNGDRTILYGTSGTKTNIAFTYKEGTSSAYRGFYTYDSATSLTKFELQSNSVANSNATVFRVLIDESEAPGEVLAVGTRNDNDTNYVRWSYTAPLDGSDSLGVSLKWANQTAGTGVDTCVDPSNNFVSEGTTSSNCGVDGFTARDINGFSTFASAAVATITGETLGQFVSKVGETDVVDFDDTDMHNATLID